MHPAGDPRGALLDDAELEIGEAIEPSVEDQGGEGLHRGRGNRHVVDGAKIFVTAVEIPNLGAPVFEILVIQKELAEKRNFLIISDEVYEKFLYEDKVHWSLASFPNAKERVILVNSFSKTYAMTGWRIGYLAAHRDILFQLLKYHHTVNICANAPAQKACVAALQGPQDCIQAMVSEYDQRRQFLVEGLNGIPGIRCVRPQGAFYVFVDIREFKMPSLEFAKYLVQETGVVTTNGSGFGCEGFLRLSYATKLDHLRDAIGRIQTALSRLSKAPL